jgi:hypothetical protein
VSFGQPTRILRLADAGDREVRPKRALLFWKTCTRTLIFDSLL